MMIFRFKVGVLLVVATLFTTSNVVAQYVSPLDCKLELSANYGEVRVNRYHMGIDIRTEQREGIVVRSVADGYISRIGIVPYGYGRAIYIAHPNGKTSVYAHLKSFTPEIEKYITKERYKARKHGINVYLKSDMFPVKAGDQIGLSGNSGMSFGPHLHFEIRESATQRTLNPIPICDFAIPDNVAPRFMKVMYIATDTINGVPMHSKPQNIGLVKRANNHYEPVSKIPFKVGRHGYFVTQVADSKNGSGSTNMSVATITQRFNDTVNFEIIADGFEFAKSRYASAATHYETQMGTKYDTYILTKKMGNKLPIYGEIRNNGVISLDQGEKGSIDIEIVDDCGNRASFAMNIVGGVDVKFSNAPQSMLIAYNHKPFHYSANGAAISIPKGALFEPIFYHQKVSKRTDSPTSAKRFSPIYEIHRATTPMFTASELSIDADGVPVKLRSKAMIAYLSSRGKWSSVGGKYVDGKITTKVRSFGQYSIVVDTLKPTIKPSFSKGANLTKSTKINFVLKDNFAGVSSFNATIDGKWILFEQDVVRSRITHYFDNERTPKTGTRHNLTITVKDGRGNTRVIETWFTR